MKVVFVRHGHSDHNKVMRLNENNDPPSHLTDKGIEQAKEASKELSERKFDAAYCSELVRTQQTAKILLQGKKTKLVIDPRLNEFQTGMHGKLVLQYYMWLLMKWNKLKAKYKDHESVLESGDRVWSFIEEMRQRHANDTILVVAHVHTFQAIVYRHKKIHPYRAMSTHIGNCEVVEIDL
ncbi:MAG: histidine phosphatase family protein [Patescibacteria group bacterium]